MALATWLLGRRDKEPCTKIARAGTCSFLPISQYSVGRCPFLFPLRRAPALALRTEATDGVSVNRNRSPPVRSLCRVFFVGPWSAASRGRPPGGGLALAVFHMVPRVPAAPNLFVHPPADLPSPQRPAPSLVSPCTTAPPHRRLSALRRLVTGPP